MFSGLMEDHPQMYYTHTHWHYYSLNILLLILFLSIFIMPFDLPYKLSAVYAKWWTILDWLCLCLLNICWSGMLQILLNSWLIIFGSIKCIVKPAVLMLVFLICYIWYYFLLWIVRFDYNSYTRLVIASACLQVFNKQ